MERTSIPNVLLLSGAASEAHHLRVAIRRAGLSAAFYQVFSPIEFHARLQSSLPEIIVTSQAGLPSLTINSIAELALERGLELVRVVDGPEARIALADSRMHTIGKAELSRTVISLLERGRTRVAAGNSANEVFAKNLRENQKLISLGRLSASIAHEINNPLESVTNLLYLINTENNLPQNVRTYLGLAQQELDRVAQISRQTLNFSRETNSPVSVKLEDLFEEVLTLYTRRIADKGINVVRRLNPSDSAVVFPGEMRQVLSNLVANAIEATARGGRLIVRVRQSRKWADHKVAGLRITIADTGAGILPEVRRRIGEPFFTTKGQAGTGLGLWVSQSIVERYGGSLYLRSSVAAAHHGTVFSIFLPTNLRPRVVAPSPPTFQPKDKLTGSRCMERSA